MLIVEANLDDTNHAAAIVQVLDTYASDAIGGGVPLADQVRERLVACLREHPTTLVLLAYEESEAVGVAICFLGFSTFKARSLLNVHDLAVVPERRGRGIGRALLTAAEDRARERECCKLTLEVQEDNSRAIGLYRSFGFGNMRMGDSAATRFLEKPLDLP